MGLKTYLLSELPELCVLGRTSPKRDPLTLFWTASGFEMNLSCSELWAEVESDYGLHENWVDVILDGELIQHFMLQKGRSVICLFRNMDPAVIRNVKLLRDTPAMPCDEDNLLQIYSVSTDGTFFPVSDDLPKLEFIGDSITSGEGCSGRYKELSWNSTLFHAYYNYTWETAAALHARYHMVCQSGWGFFCGCDGDPKKTLPGYYRQVCGLAFGERNRALGSQETWDFESYRPDVVVIALGTNDLHAFPRPNWVDPDTGKEHVLRVNEDGSRNREDEARMLHTGVSFLKTVRECNPDSYILWLCGMSGGELLPVVATMVKTYQEETGDIRSDFLSVPSSAEMGVGSRDHPGRPTHTAAARILTNRIRAILAQ